MTAPRKFEARYPGRCPACREQIEVGDDLVFNDDDVVVHFGCANRSAVPKIGQSGEVCPRCFIEKAVSGACGCEAQS